MAKKIVPKENSFTEILLYNTPNGKVKVEIYLQNETVWLSQQKIAELFGVQRPAITKHLKNIGKYTTDFLIVKRTAKDLPTGYAGKIYKALLIETKGALYAEDKVFQKKKNYVETKFLKLKQEKFGYQRFDFLYLEGTMNINNIVPFSNKINAFFND